MRGTLRAALVAASFSQAVLAEQKDYTEAELRAYDGSDKEKPLLLAIDGKIFDVSVSPSFYGPGGHYGHFAGRDATRAWVTECWDTEDQLTWRMDGIEEMFMPKYLDEIIQGYADENVSADLTEFIGMVGKDAVVSMAEKAAEKFGKLTDEEIKKRREDDLPEAKEKAGEALKHWKSFFSGNSKYKLVGNVIKDAKNAPTPPPICEAAMKKRPIKGGRLESIIPGMGGAKEEEEEPAGKPGKTTGQPKANKEKEEL